MMHMLLRFLCTRLARQGVSKLWVYEFVVIRNIFVITTIS